MRSSAVVMVSLLLLCLVRSTGSKAGHHQEVIVEEGEDVILPCHISGNVEDILKVEWTRRALKRSVFTFFLENLFLEESYQHSSYRGRVELKDPEMKDGDVCLLLKNVTFNDAGTYECRVVYKGTKPDLISSIDLRVKDIEPGQSVTLQCRAPSNTDIVAVEWTRAEQEPQCVLMYWDGNPDPDHQHPSYQNRVELKDREMKDGDVSMILKNVTRDDTGTYECHVFMRETVSRKKRASLPTEPISIVHLQVHQPGDTRGRGDEEGGDKGLHVGLGVGLTAAALVVVGGVVGFISYKRKNQRSEGVI